MYYQLMMIYKHHLTIVTVIPYYMKKEVSIWIICIISLLFSVVAICVAVWRSPELSFDYQGVIVGALSLLVTALVGWNIYTLVDLKSLQNNMSHLAEGTSKRINGNMVVTEGAHLMIYHYLLLNKDPLGIEYRFIYHGVACLMHASQIDDIPTCNAVVDAMLTCIAHPENVSVTESGKADILKLISLVKNGDKIKGFLELVKRIALLNVRNKAH